MQKEFFQTYRQHFKKNLWQSTAWASFQKVLGKKTFFLGDTEAMGLAIFQNLPMHLSYLEMPRGPLGLTDTIFWKEVKEIAQKYRCVFTRISPVHKAQSLPWLHVKAPIQTHPETTLILDLTLDEEELLKQMKPKGRYNIRIAQREKVKVFESKNAEDFYKILEETTERDKFSSHPLSYYQNMLEGLGDSVKLYLASVVTEDGVEKIIAGGIFVFMDDTCTYYYGASSDKHRDKMAPYLIQWKAITEAQALGFKKYDFLGIAPEASRNHPLEGVTRFKKQFGGEVVNYPSAVDIVYRPFVYAVYWLYKMLQKVYQY